MPFTLKEDGKVRVFLLVKEVERESVDTDILNVIAQVRSSIDTNGKKFACGVCLKVRQSEGSEICSLATMQDFYEKVKECDKAITFRTRSLTKLTSLRPYNG